MAGGPNPCLTRFFLRAKLENAGCVVNLLISNNSNERAYILPDTSLGPTWSYQGYDKFPHVSPFPYFD